MGRMPTDVFVQRDGFTTVGAACAILVSCSLVFACIWTVRSYSRASGVQAVADAAALAAENEVAEFVIAVRVADATLLTLSLTGLALFGVGSVCCCVPPAASAGKALIETGKALLQRRDQMAVSLEKSLNALQAALPVAAQVQAQAVIQENADSLSGEAVGYVELVPAVGDPVTVGPLDAGGVAQGVESGSDQVSEWAAQAEQASLRAAEAKRQAWLRDCGAMPGYCMAERASALSTIKESDNPVAHSMNTWSFAMALDRARAYYACRVQEEVPEGESVEESAKSALRKRFYLFASEELARGKAVDPVAGIPDIDLPILPRNTTEMKETSLYTEQSYPVSEGKLHAWAGCPGVGAVEGKGSLFQQDAGVYGACAECELDAAALGKVAAASTSIENGFEFHYRKVAEAAKEYGAARAEAEPALQQARAMLDDLFAMIGEAMQQAVACRVQANPPGLSGALVAVTVDLPAENSPSSFFESHDLGSFAAISAAVLAEDGQEDVLSSLLDGAKGEVGEPLTSAGSEVLGLWSALLGAYGSGVDAVIEGVSGLLSSVSLVSASGLGEWASAALEESLAGMGLAPAETSAPKAILSNTSHVASVGTGVLSTAIREAKRAA